MTDTIKNELLGLMRQYKVAEAYERLLPMIDTDDMAAAMLLQLVRPLVHMFKLHDYADGMKAGAESGNRYMQYLWAHYHDAVRPGVESAGIIEEYYTRAMNAGIADARALLAFTWKVGEGRAVDLDRYVSETSRAIEEGSIYGVLQRINQIIYGNSGFEADPQKGLELAQAYIRQSEERGMLVAPQFYSCSAHACSVMGRKDEAAGWYRKAFEEGDPNACYWWATEAAFDEDWVLTDMQKFMDITEKGREFDNATAYLELFTMLDKETYQENYSEELKKEVTDALKTQLETAWQLGSADGAEFLGMLYLDADYGFPRDPEKAFSWFARAAVWHNGAAYGHMAKMIRSGVAPERYGEDYQHECEIRALRLGAKDMLDDVVEAYRNGALTHYAAEIEKYYLPLYEKAHAEKEDGEEEEKPEEGSVTDSRKRYRDLLKACPEGPLGSCVTDLQDYCDLCSLCIELSGQNMADMDRSWETTEMARVFLRLATHLEGFDHLINYLYWAVGKMTECVWDHPRLKLELMRLHLLVARRIEAQTGHDLSAAEDLQSDIRLYRCNIEYADSGQLDKIEQVGHLKHDPVEWTARWEEVIDEADKMAYASLADVKRHMGFCFAFWHEREKALERLGVEWKNPGVMNPRVRFD